MKRILIMAIIAIIPLSVMAQSTYESLDDQVERYQQEFKAKEIQRELQWQDYKQRETESRIENLERQRSRDNMSGQGYDDMSGGSRESQNKTVDYLTTW